MGEGELGPHLMQGGKGRGILACQVLFDPSNRLATARHRLDRQTGQDRTDRQTDNGTSDSIERIVLQTVAQNHIGPVSYMRISLLFLFSVTRDLLFTNIAYNRLM